jgi:esterase
VRRPRDPNAVHVAAFNLSNRMSSILNHTRVAARDTPSTWLYLLHGIYGSGRNWGSVARRLVEERSEWGVILVDLRLHGDSTSFQPPHTLEACSADLAHLINAMDVPARAILGHSFGGKVALVHMANQPAADRQTWVVDSTLRTGEPSGSPWELLGVVRSLPAEFPSREALADALVERGYARGLGLWLAMNLERSGDAFRWKLDWDGMEEMLRDYFATDIWTTIDEPPLGVDLHIIRATESSAIGDDDQERIAKAGERTGRVRLHEVEGGHWLNVDNPDAVIRLLVEHLPRS